MSGQEPSLAQVVTANYARWCAECGLPDEAAVRAAEAETFAAEDAAVAGVRAVMLAAGVTAWTPAWAKAATLAARRAAEGVARVWAARPAALAREAARNKDRQHTTYRS